MKSNYFKRGFALFLAAVMAFGTLQTTAFAVTEETEETKKPEITVEVEGPNGTETSKTTVDVSPEETLGTNLKVTAEVNGVVSTKDESENGDTTTTTVIGNAVVEVTDGDDVETPINVEVDKDGNVKVTDKKDNEIGNTGSDEDVKVTADDFAAAVKGVEFDKDDPDITQTVRADGAIVTTKGNTTTIYYPGDGATKTYEKDAEGNTIRITEVGKDGDNEVTTTTVTNSDGSVTTTTVSGDVKVTTVKNADGTTTMTKTESLNATQWVDEQGITVTETKDENGEHVKITRKDQQSVTTYDDGTHVYQDGDKTLVVQDSGKTLREVAEDGTVTTTYQGTDGSMSQ